MSTKVSSVRLHNLQQGCSLLITASLICLVALVFNMPVAFHVIASTSWSESEAFTELRSTYTNLDAATVRQKIQDEVTSALSSFDSTTTTQTQTMQPQLYQGIQSSTDAVRTLFIAAQAEQERLRLEELERQKKMLSPQAKILLVGDSMIKEHTGIVFERNLQNMGFEVIRESKYSTGFTNTAYFDWTARVQQLIATHTPEAVIVYMGANDGQKIWSETNQTYYAFGHPEWKNEYRANVYDFLQAATTSTKKIYLMGHPIAPSADFTSKFRVINDVFAGAENDFETLTFVDVWQHFAPQDRFERVIEFEGKRLYVKFEDGVHLTNHGSEIAFDVLRGELVEDVLVRE